MNEYVSILGLVDKGLRPIKKVLRFAKFSVSILGLVDKGLRLAFIILIKVFVESFNPWFSG